MGESEASLKSLILAQPELSNIKIGKSEASLKSKIVAQPELSNLKVGKSEASQVYSTQRAVAASQKLSQDQASSVLTDIRFNILGEIESQSADPIESGRSKIYRIAEIISSPVDSDKRPLAWSNGRPRSVRTDHHSSMSVKHPSESTKLDTSHQCESFRRAISVIYDSTKPERRDEPITSNRRSMNPRIIVDHPVYSDRPIRSNPIVPHRFTQDPFGPKGSPVERSLSDRSSDRSFHRDAPSSATIPHEFYHTTHERHDNISSFDLEPTMGVRMDVDRMFYPLLTSLIDRTNQTPTADGTETNVDDSVNVTDIAIVEPLISNSSIAKSVAATVVRLPGSGDRPSSDSSTYGLSNSPFDDGATEYNLSSILSKDEDIQSSQVNIRNMLRLMLNTIVSDTSEPGNRPNGDPSRPETPIPMSDFALENSSTSDSDDSSFADVSRMDQIESIPNWLTKLIESGRIDTESGSEHEIVPGTIPLDITPGQNDLVKIGSIKQTDVKPVQPIEPSVRTTRSSILTFTPPVIDSEYSQSGDTPRIFRSKGRTNQATTALAPSTPLRSILRPPRSSHAEQISINPDSVTDSKLGGIVIDVGSLSQRREIYESVVSILKT